MNDVLELPDEIDPPDNYEPRLGLFYFSPEVLMGMILVNPDTTRIRYYQLVTETLPGGKVVGINYDHRARAFAVCVSHPSFDPVPVGQEIPDKGPIYLKTFVDCKEVP